MSELERSLFQHDIEMSGRLLPPLEATEEDPPEAGVPGTGNPLQAQVSFSELLPNTLGATLHQFAERLGVPAEACYLVVLCAAASLLPSQTRLVLDPRFGLEAPPILWGGLVGDAGSKEYRIVNTLTRPLEGLQIEHSIQYQSQLNEYKAAMRRRMRGAPIGDPIERPKPITLYTHDCTISAIGRILSRQPEWGLLLKPDGLGDFLQAARARQSRRGTNLPQWLRLYDGCTLKIERGATDPIFVRYPSVSIVGGIQMSVLRAFGNKFVNLGLNLWPRFAWARVPFVPDPDTESGPFPHPRRLLAVVYHRLQKFPPTQHKLDREGQELWNEWDCKFIEPILSKPVDVIRAMHAETKKRAARIALVLHWLDAACSGVPPSEAIPANTLGRGIELALWLQRQSETIFSEVCGSICQ